MKKNIQNSNLTNLPWIISPITLIISKCYRWLWPPIPVLVFVRVPRLSIIAGVTFAMIVGSASLIMLIVMIATEIPNVLDPSTTTTTSIVTYMMMMIVHMVSMTPVASIRLSVPVPGARVRENSISVPTTVKTWWLLRWRHWPRVRRRTNFINYKNKNRMDQMWNWMDIEVIR